MDIDIKLIYGLQTTKIFVNFHKSKYFSFMQINIFFERGSVDFAKFWKGFVTQKELENQELEHGTPIQNPRAAFGRPDCNMRHKAKFSKCIHHKNFTII